MSAKENKEMYIQIIKDLNASKGDIDKIHSMMDKYCAPGYINHNARRGDMTLDQAAQYYAELWAAFPDLAISIDEMVAEGDKLAARCTAQGTHNGNLMGIPATGKRIVATTWQISQIVGGKAVEVWELPDALGMMIQLGVVPDPAKSAVPH